MVLHCASRLEGGKPGLFHTLEHCSQKHFFMQVRSLKNCAVKLCRCDESVMIIDTFTPAWELSTHFPGEYFSQALESSLLAMHQPTNLSWSHLCNLPRYEIIRFLKGRLSPVTRAPCGTGCFMATQLESPHVNHLM